MTGGNNICINMFKMMQLNPEKEWKILNYEMFENKPDKAPFPKFVVKRREFLLYAQCLLSDYEVADSKEEKEIFGAAYMEIMGWYFTEDL